MKRNRLALLGAVFASLLLSGCGHGTAPITGPGTGNGNQTVATGTGVAINSFGTDQTLLGGMAVADNNVYYSTTTELGIMNTTTQHPGSMSITASAHTVRPFTWPVIPNASLTPTGAVASSAGTVGALATQSNSTSTSIRIMSITSATPVLVLFNIQSASFTELDGTPGDVFEDVAFTNDGNAWVTANTPTPNGLLGYIFTTKAGIPHVLYTNGIGAIGRGADGNLWFTSDSRVNPFSTPKIYRYSPTTGLVINTYLPGAGTLINAFIAGPDKALWFTDTGHNQIGRLTTGGAFTRFNIPTANSGPDGIATGCDGALWFTEANANQIGRVTTTGQFTEYPVTQGTSLGDMAGCVANSLYFSSVHAIGQVVAP